MDTKELLKKVRQIQIKTSHMVDDVLAGQYHSAFRGRGMEFDEVREYTHGDDIRTIDWNVTARTGVPHVKRYIEERELTVLLIVDISGSTVFGSCHRTKRALCTELAAFISISAARSNDKTGLMLFSDRIERFIPPKKGKTHSMRIIRELLEHAQPHPGTDVIQMLEYLGRVQKKRSVIFIISDFLVNQDFEDALRLAKRRHDVICVHISDPREEHLADVGLLAMVDAESGRPLMVDTSSKHVREMYAKRQHDRRKRLRETFLKSGVDHIHLCTSKPYLHALKTLFKKREKRLRR